MKSSKATKRLEGIPIHPGLALGYAYFHDPISTKLPYKEIDNPPDELHKFNEALTKVKENLEKLQNKQQDPLLKTILDAQHAIFLDSTWQTDVQNTILEHHTAAFAIKNIIKKYKEKFSHDTYWSSRFFDYEIIFEQIIDNLNASTTPEIQIKHPLILIAETVSPKDVLTFHQQDCVGLILADTGSSSHGAIVAKSLNIPVVGGIFNAHKRIDHEDELMIDGTSGNIIIKPKQKDYSRIKSKNIEVKRSFVSHKTQTKDGVEIKLYINANLANDVRYLDKVNATGVGLFRSEISFLAENMIPSFGEQVSLYRDIFNTAKKRPVYFRTLDIRSDKLSHILHNWPTIEDEKKEIHALMSQQLRALIEAKKTCDFPDYPLFIMMPMVTQTQDFIAFKQFIFGELCKGLDQNKRNAQFIKVGAMIEVPAIAYDLSSLMPHLDFCSIGSNDLFHFFYGLDRQGIHADKAEHDMLAIPFLMLLKDIIQKANEYNCPVSLCGEMASHPHHALALIGLGLRRLSLNMYDFVTIENIIKEVNFKEFNLFFNDLLHKKNSHNLTLAIENWLKQKKVA